METGDTGGGNVHSEDMLYIVYTYAIHCVTEAQEICNMYFSESVKNLF